MKVLIEDNIAVQIMNQLKRLPYSDVEGLIFSLSEAPRIQEFQPQHNINPIGYTTQQYTNEALTDKQNEDNDE